MLNGKVILITGGTGSFGRKFTEIILNRYKPKKIIIFSRDEYKQYEMAKTFPDGPYPIRYFLGDVRDKPRLCRAFQGVDYIIHAAAQKIVPTAEYNPFEAVYTNVIGAENVINAAIDCHVDKVIALSTDKAVNPVNLYGATKLCAEKIFIAANNYSPHGTRFSVVRYGNVLASRGSVVPFFKECRGRNTLPVTDMRMTRFWTTLQEASDFVIKALELMKCGEVFVPKLPSMKIIDLAKAIAPECEFDIIGIRPGEKLHETLISSDDNRRAIEKKDMYIIYPDTVTIERDKLPGKFLPETFDGYRSDNNTAWLSTEELKRMVYEKEHDADEKDDTLRKTVYR